jgi:HAD superfamily hydrolase (TIGR01484 family)
LAELTRAGFHVIPVTGRPAGWCELIARLWPVHGVVGENGAFYFRFDGSGMQRVFVRSEADRAQDLKQLQKIREQILHEVPGSAVASDQFCRLFDLAIDFSEDVKPLPREAVEKIVRIFREHGATAKVSNIHVNGWFGNHDKLSTCELYLQSELHLSEEEILRNCAFIGDSPNDEPMFEHFPNSFAVANIREFSGSMKHLPRFVASAEEADGFVEVARKLLALKS